MIAAVLVVPADGDPGGLLREGPCGARPPMALPDNTGAGWRWRPYDDAARSARIDHDPRGCALVLSWDGATVPEGCDRAVRALNAHDRDHGGPKAAWMMWDTYLLGDVVNQSALIRYGLASRIVRLDAKGREVSGG
jgi:hypothetical protein